MDEIASAPPPQANNNKERVVNPARAYFERTFSKASLLNTFCKSDSLSKADPDFLPARHTYIDWSKAKIIPDSTADVVQVPIEAGVKLYGRRSYNEPGSLIKERTRAYTRLVVRTQKDGHSAFVYTLIPDRSFNRDTTLGYSVSSLTYKLGGMKYSGLIIYSDLNGRFLKGLRYVDGKAKSRIYPAHHAHAHGIDIDSTKSMSLHIIDNPLQPSKSSSGGGEGEECCWEQGIYGDI